MEKLALDTGTTQNQHEAGTFWIPIIESYLNNKNTLPPYLGLTENTFSQLCSHFQITVPDNYQHKSEIRVVIAELSDLRLPEQQDLISLLNEYSVSRDFSKEMSTVLSAACMGTQHLWKDLGMPERPLLTQLFGYFYPELREMNNRNMRWKRFLYRQLCSSGGDYICRSPSCETCTSFNECFADD